MPARAANAASLRQRPGWEKRHDGLGGADRADAAAVGQAGGEVVDDGLQLGAVGLAARGAASRRARARRRISAWRTACSRLASRRQAGGGPGRPGAVSVSAPRARLAVGVVAGQQQGAEPVGLRGAGGGELLAGAEQDPQRLAVAVGARGGQPVGVQAQRGQHGQVRVDRVGLALAAAGLAVGLFALDDEQPGRGGGAGQPDAVAAGALDRDGQPRSGGVVDDPGQQLGVAGGCRC